jgi:hypothetical protein
LRCCRAAGFFPAVSFACFLPEIGISISFWPAAAFRGFLPDSFGAFVSAAAPPTLRRNASIRSTTFAPRGRSFGVIGFPERGGDRDFRRALRCRRARSADALWRSRDRAVERQIETDLRRFHEADHSRDHRLIVPVSADQTRFGKAILKIVDELLCVIP